LRRPSAASNCQAGRAVRAARACSSASGSSPLPSCRISAGARRASQPGSSASRHSARLAAGQRQPRQAQALAHAVHGQQPRIAALGEQLAVGHRPRRDDAHHLALHRPLGGADLADLFGNRHRLAELDQPREVVLERVHRHAGHRHRLARALAARGQRDVQQPVGAPRVAVEEFVEVPHAVEHEGVRKLGLDAQVLRHHRRVSREVALPGRCGGNGLGHEAGDLRTGARRAAA
jgi:hypothetical protein